MRQSLSLSRPATVKLLHITLRTLHNWESGKVRIPYAAFKLIRLFSSYPIFHPIWKDWRIVGSRLITPEGHSLEAGNFHWLSLMARRAEAFTKVNQQLRERRASDCHALRATVPVSIVADILDFGSCSTGLVYNSTSGKLFNQNQQIQGSQPHLLWVENPTLRPPSSNTGGKTSFSGGKTPKSALFHPQSHRSNHQQLSTGGAL